MLIQEELQIPALMTSLENLQLGWSRHVDRMDGDRIAKLAFHRMLDGGKPRGGDERGLEGRAEVIFKRLSLNIK